MKLFYRALVYVFVLGVAMSNLIAAAGQLESFSIENETLRVSFEASEHAYRFEDKRTGRTWTATSRNAAYELIWSTKTGADSMAVVPLLEDGSIAAPKCADTV